MSKMDALRAMREARYEQAAARAGQAAKTTPAKPAAKRKPPVAPPVAPRSEETGSPGQEPALCGHRNMSGRTCTREHGHSAKSHRYS